MARTILRPTQFASNAVMWAATVRNDETVHAPYAQAALPTIHRGGIAAVARVACTQPGHQGHIHALTGPELITPRQQMRAIAAALGRVAPFSESSRRHAHADMAAILGAETADAVLDVIGGDVNPEVLRVHDTVPRLTGCPARPFRQWAAENADAFR